MKMLLLSLFLGINLICVAVSNEDFSRHERQISSYADEDYQNVAQIERVDVQCSNTGISVTVEFDRPFNGLIYSKGYYANRRCRYVQANSGSRRSSFVIPAGECGTQKIGGKFNNVLIFQMDETIQEVWDIAKKVSCEHPDGFDNRPDTKKHGKTVVFRPLTVGMVDVQHQRFEGGEGFNCWMDIQLGHFPNTVPIGGQVKIGEELSVIIYLQDDKRMYDVGVKDCWAYNNDDFDDPSTSKVQLTDEDGCVKKTKLIGNWRKTYEPGVGGAGATTIAYTNMTAFKFPDGDNVHLTCNIEVCEDYCEETCASNSGAVLPSHRPHLAPTTLAPYRPTTAYYRPTEPPRARETTTLAPFFPTTTSRPPICYPNNFDSRCPKETRVSLPATSDESDIVRDVETEEEILPGGYTPKPRPYPTTTARPTQFQCYPGSLDARCLSPTPKPPSHSCYPGEISPYCPPLCTPGSTDKRCYTEPEVERVTTPRPTTTYRPPVTYEPTTRKPVTCYPGMIDPRCPPICTPGSTDRRCPEPTTQRPYTTTQPPRTYPTTSRPTPFQCYPGSPDSRCTTPKAVTCYPGQIDPRCPPICTPGSTDKRCPQPTTQRPYTPTQPPRTYPTTPRPTPFQCYPGSLDARCTTPKAVTCYPGQIDPRCPPVCTPGSTDRRCYVEPEEEEEILPGGQTPSTTARTTTYRTTPRTYPTTTYRTTPRTYPTTTYRTTPRTYQTTERTYSTTTYRTTPTTYRTTPRTYPTTTYQTPRTYPTTTYRTTPRTYQTTYRTTARTYPTTTYRPFITERTTPRTYPTTAFTTKKPLCYPGQIDPRCEPMCYPGTTDKRCSEAPRTTTPKPYTTTQPPRTYQTTPRTTPFQCYPGSLDSRCFQPTTPRPTYQTTKKPTLCYPGTIDPRCPPVCTPGSTDRRCYVEEEEEILPGGQTPSTTFRTTTYRTTQFQCFAGSLDPRCLPTTRAPVTYPTYPTRAPVTYPTFPTTTPRTYTTTTYRPQPTTTRTTPRPFTTTTFRALPTTTRTTPRPFTTTTYRPLPTTTRTTPRPFTTTYRTLPTTARTYPTTTTRPVQCYPGAIDPRCPPICTPGSTDRRCPTTSRPYPTTQPPRTYPTTTRTTSFQCYTGSLDPRCIQTTTRPPPVYQTTTTKKPVLCYPGQIDPRCPPICTPGSTDKRCYTEVSTTTPRSYPTTTTFRTTTQRPTLPPRTTERGYSYSQPAKKFCYPGEPGCEQKPVAKNVDNQLVDQSNQSGGGSPRGPICYPGSFDSRCPKTGAAPAPASLAEYDDVVENFAFESKRISSGEYF